MTQSYEGRIGVGEEILQLKEQVADYEAALLLIMSFSIIDNARECARRALHGYGRLPE